MLPLDGTDEKAIKAWLLKKNTHISVAIAARCALRVLPIVWFEQDRTEGDFGGDVLLPVLRATAVTWAVAKYPILATELAHIAANAADAADAAVAAASAAAAAAVDDEDGYAADAAGAAADAAQAAVAAAGAAAVGAPSGAAADSAYAVFAAGAAASVAADRAAASNATQADVEAIERGRSAKQLVNQRLWPRREPETRALWAKMKARLLTRPDEHFEVWTDWYEARLAGHRTNDTLELARVMIADDLWRRGPAVVNAEIKRLIAEHTPTDPKAAAAALAQRPAAFAFRVVDDKIDAAPEDAAPPDPATTDDLHRETKRKAEALRERLERMQADTHLRANVERLIARLSGDSAALRPGLILSALRALQADFRAWDTEEGRKELSPADLSRLVDLTETTRDLAASFPKAREIEAEAISLDLPEKVDEIESQVVEIVDAMDRSDGATKPAKAAIHETVAGVPEARTEADRRKQLAYSLLDIGNFARAGLSFVKASGGRLAAPVGKGARVAGRELGGLGKDGWKGFRKGFPKGVESGARKIGHVMIVGGATALMAHLAGPLAALGTLVSSFAPLGKIAKELSDDTDDEDAAGEDAASEEEGVTSS